ncbi:PDR/VanB family oxidoreductase [Actinomadura sp. WMMB 499]|uniref:PDR/VanB family oxidoreductase n=1 Tax=Actinomadura sp. WMMB 499 TaxID=1219491 RepID=UPI0012493C70|nr:PDR/VanB family oxidoreductase [Actinomadura sp. WMMB 499]QFG22413.1 oxidoreductase [Actinomadura sp. WMMB 499]
MSSVPTPASAHQQRSPYGRVRSTARRPGGSGGPLVVAAKTFLSPSLVTLDLREPNGRPLPRWTAGSHVNLVLAHGLVRPYSLCGRTDERGFWRILVRRHGRSRGASDHIHDSLRTGDRIEHLGVQPGLTLAGARRYRFLAGGAGIAPLIPLARLAASAGVPWSMTLFGHDARQVAGWQELADLAPALTVARKDEAIATGLQDMQSGTAVYACGPEPFVTAVDHALAGRPGARLFRESFTGPAAGGPSRAVELVLARSKLSFSVPAGTSLNEGLRAMGVEVPVACGAGFCGACAVKVLEGAPDHRDRLLSAEERAAGNVILTCVSRSRTPELLLDL